MFSPKAYLQDILTRQLFDWVENVQEDSIKVGVLEGDFQLSNLVMKRKTWLLSPSLSLSLEFGSIEKVSIQIPWLSLHKGQVNMFADNVTILLKVNLVDYNKSDSNSNVNENLSHELKMDTLHKAEIKSLGDTESSGKSSWMTGGSIGSIFNALISKAASNFSLTLHNIKVSILLPNSTSDSSYLKFNLKSLVLGSIPHTSPHEPLNNFEAHHSQSQHYNDKKEDVNSNNEQPTTSTTAATIDFEPLLWKDIQIRDISVTINKVKTCISQKDHITLVRNKQYDTVGVFLNPFQLSIQILGSKDKLAKAHFQNLKLLELEIKLNNIEFTPAGEQFVFIVETIKYVKQENLKFKYHAIHTSLNAIEKSCVHNSTKMNTSKGIAMSSIFVENTTTTFDPRKAWQLAIRAVMLMIKQNTDEIGIRPKLSSVIERLRKRRLYLFIYRRIVKTKLVNAHGIQYKSLSIDNNSNCSVYHQNENHFEEDLDELGLTKELKKCYDELNYIFSISDLMLFRLTVLREFQMKDVSNKHLKDALTFKKSRFFNWHNWFNQTVNSNVANAADTSSSSIESIEKADIQTTSSSSFIFSCKCTLSRVAITLYDNFLVDSSHFDFSNLHYSTPIVPPAESSQQHQQSSNLSKSSGTKASTSHPKNTFKKKKKIENVVPMPPVSAVPCLSIVFYGACVSMLFVNKHDKVITCRLGLFKFFGYNGTEIISCGDDPNYWLHCNFDKASKNDEINHEQAIFASVKWNREENGSINNNNKRDRHRKKLIERILSRDSDENEADLNIGEDEIEYLEEDDDYGEIYEPWSSSSSDSSSTSSKGESVSSEEKINAISANRDQDYINILSAADKKLRYRFRKDRIVEGELQSLISLDGKNVVLNLKVDFLHINWHKETAIFITDFCKSISCPTVTDDSKAVAGSDHLTLGLETKPFTEIKSKLAILSANQTLNDRSILESYPNISLQIFAEGLNVSIPVERKVLGKTLEKQKSFLVLDASKVLSKDNHTTPAAGGVSAGGGGAMKPSIPSSGLRYFQNPSPSKSPQESPQHVQFSIGKISFDSGKFLKPDEDCDKKTRKLKSRKKKIDDTEDSSSVNDDSQDESLKLSKKADLFGAHSDHSNTPNSDDRDNKSCDDDNHSIETIDEKLYDLIQQVRSKVVHSILFCVQDIEICILSSYQVSTNIASTNTEDKQNSKRERYPLTSKPWSLKGILSPCLIKSSPLYTDMRIDLLCSPLKLLVSTQDIITLIDVGKEFSSVINPAITDSMAACLVSPRIRRLAGMSDFFADTDVEEFTIEFLLESNRSKGDLKSSSIAATALSNYGNIVKLRGKNSFVSISREMIALNQLYNLGIRKEKAMNALSNFVADITEDNELELNYYVDKYVSLLFTDIYQQSSTLFDFSTEEECKAVFFYLQIFGVHLVHHKLTYDSRSLLCFGDITLFNNERIPLLSIANALQPRIEHLSQSQLKEYLNKSSESRIYKSSKQKIRSKSLSSSFKQFSNPSATFTNTKSTLFRKNIELSSKKKKLNKQRSRIESFQTTAELPSHNISTTAPNYLNYFSINSYEKHFSIIVMYEMKDLNNQFGKGGLDVDVLYKIVDADKFDIREGELTISVRQIDFLLATNNVLEIVQQALSTVSQVKSHYRENFRFQQPASKVFKEASDGKSSSKAYHMKVQSSPATSSSTHIPGSGTSLDKLTLEPTNNSYVHEYKTKLAIIAEVSTLSLILSVEENYLAKLSLYILKASLEDVTNLQKEMVHTVVIQTLALIDLSSLGAVHQIVLWKRDEYLPIDVVLEDAVQSKIKLFNPDNIYKNKNAKAKKIEELQQNEKLRIESAAPVATLIITLNEQKDEEHNQLLQTLQININVDGLRACFLYRFLEELMDFFKDKLVSPLALCFKDAADKAKLYDESDSFTNIINSSKSHFSDESSDEDNSLKANVSVKSEPEAQNVVFTVDIHINVKDISGVVPRNSNSHQLIGLNIENGSVVITNIPHLFSAPKKNEVFEGLNPNDSDSNCPLHLDLSTNQWRYKPSVETIRINSRNEAKFSINEIRVKRTLDRSRIKLNYFSQQVSSSNRVTNSTESNGQGRPLLPSTTTTMVDGWDINNTHQTYLVDFDNAPYRWKPSLSNAHLPVLEEVNDAEFYDMESSWRNDLESDREYKRLLKLLESSKHRPQVHTPKKSAMKEIEKSDVLRIAITAFNINVFVSFPDKKKNGNCVIDTEEQKVWLEISHDSKVNKFIKKTSNKGTWSENQIWRKVSMIPFNLLVVIDMGIKDVKLLFGDTYKVSHVHLNISQSEFYLLMGFWFDNLNERAQFTKLSNNISNNQKSEIDSKTTENQSGLDNKKKNNVRFSTCSNNSDESKSVFEYLREVIEVDDPLIEETKYMKKELPHYSFHSYGNKEFVKYMLERDCTFEILVLLAEVRIECSLDTNFFSKKIPNHSCLASLLTKESQNQSNISNKSIPENKIPRTKLFKSNSAKYSYEEHKDISKRQRREHPANLSTTGLKDLEINKTIPIADIKLSAFILHIEMDNDVLHMSMSVGECAVYDIRLPKQTLIPLALRIASPKVPTIKSHVYEVPPLSTSILGEEENEYCNFGASINTINRRLYGYSDFKFGFDMSPSDVHDPIDVPMKMSCILSTISNWNTMNIGVDMLDLNVQKLDLILLISDFFSCYFRFPEFGHPGVIEFCELKLPYLIPYGGNDIRVFINRPHVSILKSPLMTNSQVLLLETEDGIFFRYMLDTKSTVKMDLNITNLAIVLVKKFRPPNLNRRMRGSSGSGKGVRTLVEYLNLTMTYHYVVQGNQLDLKLVLRGPNMDHHDDSVSSTKSNTSDSINKEIEKLKKLQMHSYVDLQAEQLQLTASTVPFPFSIYPLIGSRTDFVSHSCDIVTSYEDLMLCIATYNEFFDIDGGGGGIKETSKNRDSMNTKHLNVFFVLSLFGIRVIIVDNVLGLHLPLIQIFLDDFEVTALNEDPLGKTSSLSAEKQERIVEKSRRDSFTFELSRLTNDLSQENIADQSSSVIKQEVSLYIKCTIWVDYFNNLRKCWEPLLEKVVLTSNFEKSITRGTGFAIYISSSLHINISGAFFRCLNDLLASLKSNSEADSKGSTARFLFVQKMRGKKSQDEDYMDLDFNDDLTGQSRFDFSDYNKAHWQKRSRRTLQSSNISINSSDNNRSTRRIMNQRRSSIMGALAAQDDDESIKGSHKLDHMPSNPLPFSFKVGFSIQNLTGQHIRYLQQWEGNRRTVQYLNNNERGLLNFVASKSVIRNNSSIEETFDVQLEQNIDRESSRNYRKVNGNRVAVQVSGYRWLHEIQADVLGVSYEDLDAVIGKLRPTQVFPKNWKIINSLKLMIEVVPYCGGRMLKLRSVFTIKNNTKHKLKILAKEGSSQSQSINHVYSDESKDVPFILDAGENFYVPLALMRRSALLSSGKSLGYLYLKPFDLSAIEEELQSRTNYQAGDVEYTTDPINLFQTVSKSYEAEEEMYLSSIIGDPLSLLDHGDKRFMQLVCHIQPKIHAKHGKKTLKEEYDRGTLDYERQKAIGRSTVANKLPPFCYCIEVQRDNGGSILAKVENAQQSMLSGFFLNKRSEQSYINPSNFTISIHPPIIIENLLPCGGIFEIVHAIQKRVLWSSFVSAGEAKPVHTVTLEEPLLLQVNLKYCRSSEGVIIHQPKRNDSHESLVGKFAGRIKSTIGGLLEENINDVTEDVASIILTDTVGQRIRLHVENIVGGGGQRQLAIYCPYWILNTSQYSFRIIEEGTSYFPAGTVTSQKDGTVAVPNSGASFADIQAQTGYDQTTAALLGMNAASTAVNLSSPTPQSTTNEGTQFTPQNRINQSLLSSSANKKIGNSEIPIHANRLEGVVFPGCYGQLHNRNNPEFERSSDLFHQLEQLPFKDMVNLSYLYNFAKAPVLLTKQKVKFQFDDTEWTGPYSLDAVGVNQFIKVNDYFKGCQELSFTVHLAPGRLSKYTKIVRFLPRFSIVNKLPYNLLILQPTGFAGEASTIEISPDHIKPYHLPALFGERKIALQIEGWYRSVSFSIDQITTFNLLLRRRIELGSIAHVSTRGAPEYAQVLPPLSSWGIFFETDWKEENIVVKGIKKGSHASKETDIKIGDVLISIDGELVDGKNFELAMTLLKNKLTHGCTVLFRTVEEKFRLIRESALIPTNTTSGKVSSTTSGVKADISHNEDQNDPMSPLSSNSRSYSTHAALESQLHKLNRISEQYIESNKNSMEIELRVELKLVESNVMISIQPLNPDKHYEYRIENRSVCYKMFYKQKGVVGNRWIIINPGQSRPYIWEDPFKPHKLLVLCGENLLCPVNSRSYSTYSPAKQFKVKGQEEDGLSGYWEHLAGLNIDYSTIINFDEIGCKVTFNLSHKTDLAMIATVKSEGPLKTLLIAPSMDNNFVNRELKYCVGFLKDQNIRLQEIIDTSSGLTTHINSQAKLDLLNDSMTDATQKIKEDQRKSIEIDNIMYSNFENIEEGDLKNTETIQSSLLAYCPFERLLDVGIQGLNQLEVEVFEAKELPPLVSGKMEDIYCEISIKTDDLFLNALRKVNQKFYTYICDNTLEPSWLEQKFVYNIPDKAIAEPRKFNLRISVKARSLVGLDAVLGKTDIEFSCLKEEGVLEGWFPLRPARSSLTLTMTGSIKLKIQWIHSTEGYINYLMDALEKRNSILKLQQNVQRFALKYLLKLESNRSVTNRIKNKRLKRVQKYKNDKLFPLLTNNNVERNYYELFEALAKKEEKANSIILKAKRNQNHSSCDSNHHYDGNDIGGEVLSRRESTENIKRLVERKALQLEINEIANAMDKLQSDDLSDSPLKSESISHYSSIPRVSSLNLVLESHQEYYEEEFDLPESVKSLCPILMGQKAIMQNWAKDSLNNAHVHYRLSTIMKRDSNILVDIKAFRDRFDEECYRSFIQVHIQEGILEITPMQALHIPETYSNLLVRVSYGEQSQSTFAMPHSSFLSWYHDQETSFDGTKNSIYPEENISNNNNNSNTYGANTDKRGHNSNISLAKRFEVDTKNIRGALRVRVLADRSINKTHKEIAKIEIPIFNLLNCCSTLEKGEYYDRWFPLMLSSEYCSCEGETEKDFRNNVLPEQIVHSVFGNQPCIRLRVRWMEANSNQNNTKSQAHIEESKLYAKIHLPSLSIGLIDSIYSREVMQIAVRGLDLRHSILTDRTDINLNITWIQIDNQLPDPVATVILCPTRVKHHQPVVRLQVSKNNLLSQGKLNSYDTIQLVVQELDLRLEQQTVIASWELLKSFIHEKKYASKANDHDDASNLMSENNITTIDSMGFSTHLSEQTFEWLPSWEEDLLQQYVNEDGKEENFADNAEGHDNNKKNDILNDENVRTMYVDYFTIKPIRLNVSFITTPQILQSGKIRKQRRSAFQSSDEMSGSGSNMSLFFWQMGEVVLDLTSTISDAPIIFNGFEKFYLFKTAKEIANTLQAHYILSALGQLYKIVGSLELVGNPIGLFSSLGTGVKDFFYEPAYALITTPTEIRKIGRGMVKGTVSMVSKTTLGTLRFGTNIIRSIGRGFAKLSIDSAYMRQREELQRQQTSLAANVARPVKDIYYGFHYAVVGIVKIPVNTMNKGIIKGLLPGVARGILGLATNPIVGSFDAVAHSCDFVRDVIETSIRDTILTEPVQRLRLSDLFGPDGRILPYSFPIALGTEILHALDRSNLELGVNLVLTEGGRMIGDAKSLLQRFDSAPQENVKRGSWFAPDSPHLSVIKRRSRFSFSTDDLEEENIRYLRSGKGMHEYIKTKDESGADMQPDSSDRNNNIAEFNSLLKHYKEYVIYTAIIRQSVNMDLVILITTERIIITEYHRRLNSSYLKEQWGSLLRINNVPIISPIFERSGGKATLTLLQSANNAIQLHALLRSSSYTIIANYNEEDVVINIHNCIIAVLHLPENLIPTYNTEHNDCVEDESGIIHIGPWQFSREFFDSSKVQDNMISETKEILKELELEEWVHRPKKVPSSRAPNTTDHRSKHQLNYKLFNNLPTWLIYEQEDAVNAHSHIRSILDHCNNVQNMCKTRPKSKLLMRLHLDELYQGRIEYSKFVETLEVLDLAHNQKSDKRTHTDMKTVDSGDPSGFNSRGSVKKRASFLFPFRSTASNASTTADLNGSNPENGSPDDATYTHRPRTTSISDRFMAFAKMRRYSTTSIPTEQLDENPPPTNNNDIKSAVKSTTISSPGSEISPLSMGYGSTVNTTNSIPPFSQTQNGDISHNIKESFQPALHSTTEMRRKFTLLSDSEIIVIKATPISGGKFTASNGNIFEEVDEKVEEGSFMPNFKPFADYDTTTVVGYKENDVIVRTDPEIDVNNFVPSRTYVKYPTTVSPENIITSLVEEDHNLGANHGNTTTSVKNLFKQVSVIIDPLITQRNNNKDNKIYHKNINYATNNNINVSNGFADGDTKVQYSSTMRCLFKPVSVIADPFIATANSKKVVTTNKLASPLSSSNNNNDDDEVVDINKPKDSFLQNPQNQNNKFDNSDIIHNAKEDKLISKYILLPQQQQPQTITTTATTTTITTEAVATVINKDAITENTTLYNNHSNSQSTATLALPTTATTTSAEVDNSLKYLMNRLTNLETIIMQSISTGMNDFASTTTTASTAIEAAAKATTGTDTTTFGGDFSGGGVNNNKVSKEQLQIIISNERNIIIAEMMHQNQNRNSNPQNTQIPISPTPIITNNIPNNNNIHSPTTDSGVIHSPTIDSGVIHTPSTDSGTIHTPTTDNLNIVKEASVKISKGKIFKSRRFTVYDGLNDNNNNSSNNNKEKEEIILLLDFVNKEEEHEAYLKTCAGNSEKISLNTTNDVIEEETCNNITSDVNDVNDIDDINDDINDDNVDYNEICGGTNDMFENNITAIVYNTLDNHQELFNNSSISDSIVSNSITNNDSIILLDQVPEECMECIDHRTNTTIDPHINTNLDPHTLTAIKNNNINQRW